MRKGILVGGNWIIDQIKVVDIYPQEQTLANILSQYHSNGGCAYNLLKALYFLGLKCELEAVGIIGEDAFGNMIKQDCHTMNIDTQQLLTSNEKGTSYTDVMSVKSTGKRTFFHYRGANALLNQEHFDFTGTQSKIFHLGYLMLLDELDKVDADGITGAANVLKSAKSHGIITSVDLVSEDSHRFKTVVPPALPYVDYLFVNEFELGRLTGKETFCESGVLEDNCLDAIQKVFAMGVNQWIILHFEAGAIAVNKDGEQFYQSAVNLPEDQIRGAVGAGDAFAAGVLLGVHEGWSITKSLELGVSSACSSLMHVSPSEGIKSYTQCLDMILQYGLKTKA